MTVHIAHRQKVLLLLPIVVSIAIAQGSSPSRRELLTDLRRGGYVILMRHASSPRAVPDGATANPDNTTLERQLDEAGRNSAIAFGKALRELKIPVGAVLASPTYRARETIKLAQLPTPNTHDELGDGGQSMQGASAAQGQWLRHQVTLLPKGTNTFIVTHYPDIAAAFPGDSSGLADGEALVFDPGNTGGTTLRARVKIEEWPALGK